MKKRGIILLIGIFSLIFSINSFVSAGYCTGSISCSALSGSSCQGVNGCTWQSYGPTTCNSNDDCVAYCNNGKCACYSDYPMCASGEVCVNGYCESGYCYGTGSCSSFDHTSASICQSYSGCIWQSGCLIDSDCNVGETCEGEGGSCSGNYLSNFKEYAPYRSCDAYTTPLKTYEETLDYPDQAVWGCNNSIFSCDANRNFSTQAGHIYSPTMDGFECCINVGDAGKNMGYEIIDGDWYEHSCVKNFLGIGGSHWSHGTTYIGPAYEYTYTSCSGLTTQSSCTPSGCSWEEGYGTCTEAPVETCEDSDGSNVTNKGTCEDLTGKYNDTCAGNSLFVDELSCSNGICVVNTLPCPSGYTCTNGACIGCTPSCAGKMCGDNGCGGSCGNCAVDFGENYTCNEFFQCVCGLETKEEFCTRLGKECGTATGEDVRCGTGIVTRNCPMCPPPEICNSDGQCVSPEEPNVYWAFYTTEAPIPSSSEDPRPITLTYNIKMVVENSGLPEGSASFEVFENDLLFDDNIRTGALAITGSVDANGKAVATWTINQTDIDNSASDDSDEDYEFYFKVNDDSDLKSGYFYAYIHIGFCTGKMYCSHYNTSTDCSADICLAAEHDGASREIDCVSDEKCDICDCGDSVCDDCYCSWNDGSDVCEFVSGSCGADCPGKPIAADICAAVKKLGIYNTLGQAICREVTGSAAGPTSCSGIKCPAGPAASTIDVGVQVPVYNEKGYICKKIVGTKACSSECTCPNGPSSDTICEGEGVSVKDDCDSICRVKWGTKDCSGVSCPTEPTEEDVCGGVIIPVNNSNGDICRVVTGTADCSGVTCPEGPDPSTICDGEYVLIENSIDKICNIIWGNLECGLSDSFKAGTCIYHDTSTDNCDDGYLSYSWTAEWVWDEDNPLHLDPNNEESKCIDGSSTVECPAQIQLPFFGIHSLIAAIAIIILVYLILNSKKHKKR